MPNQITGEFRSACFEPEPSPSLDNDGNRITATDCYTWELAPGCTLHIGNLHDPAVEDGPLRVMVATSDQHQIGGLGSTGITVRTVTPEQVTKFGRMLLDLGGNSNG